MHVSYTGMVANCSLLNVADVDECVRPGLGQCGHGAVCKNTPGSFLCVCQEGFVGDGHNCTSEREISSQSMCLILFCCLSQEFLLTSVLWELTVVQS